MKTTPYPLSKGVGESLDSPGGSLDSPGGSLPATPSQTEMLKSLWQTLQSLYRRIGGSYASYSEYTMHRMFYERKLTIRIHSDWAGYGKLEAQKCIPALKNQIEWARKKIREHDERRAKEVERIKIECMSWTQMHAWMQGSHPHQHAACYFTFAVADGKFTYWRLRDTPVSLLIESDARAEYKTLNFEALGKSFEQCYAKINEEGWHYPFYKRLFQTGANF